MPLGTGVLFYCKGVGRMKKILCLTVIALFLSGCAITDKKNKLAMAAVVGGVAGGFVGFSVFGPGTSGMLAAFALGGASAGAAYLATEEVLYREERAELHRATYQSLQHGKEGEATEWVGPQSGASAKIMPTRTFRDQAGRLCRDFVVVFDIGRTRDSVKRTACQGIDGSWQTI
jgi:surface antigen